MNLADVMDELAARIDAIDGLRVHAYPPDNVHPPAAVVTYPDEYTFDETFGRGMDRLTIPVVVLVGRVSDRKSRDQLAAYVNGTGVKSIKAALEGATYLNLADTGGFASTPDHADFNTSIFDVRILMAPDDWTPGGFGSNHYIGQEDAAAVDKAWALSVHSNGHPRLAVYTDGTDASLVSPSECDTATGFVDGTKHWLRASFVGNFSGFRVFNYFTAEDNGTTNPTWVPLGSAIITAGAVTLHNSSQPLRIFPAVLPGTGKVWYAEVQNNGTIVANPDFRKLLPGTTSFTDSTGKVWTINGTAQIVADPNASPTYTAFDSVRVTGAEFDIVRIADVDYLAATFTLDIAGTGT